MGGGSSPSLLLIILLNFMITYSYGNPELRALMEVKSALDPDGKLLTSWTGEGDPCSAEEFQGVACNEHGKVANISLQGKGLSGSISPAIAQLSSLSGLYLHYNALKGEIPKQVASLTELVDLYLNVNNLSGSIPVEVGSMASLQVLQLCYNQLTGSIPTQLGLAQNLYVVALQSNHLTGAIPASLGDLTQLTRLDLSFNMLFGSIPTKLADLPQLLVLDLRNNTLSGNVPSGLGRLSGGFQFGNNTGLCGVGFSSLRLCTSADLLNPDQPKPIGHDPNPLEIPRSANLTSHCNTTHCSNSSKSSAVTITVVIIAVLVTGIVTGLLFFAWYRRQKQKIGSSQELSDGRLSTDQPTKLMHQNHTASPLASLEYSYGWDPMANGLISGEGEVSQSFRFNLEEVECATQYFSDANLLGRSNFASTYKGILRDGTVVAVKSINKTSCKMEEADFLKGLKLLTVLRHENLAGLRGFCCSRGRGECFLVYDFVPNGSLSQFLDVKVDEKKCRVLEWPLKVSIIKGIAKGIEYLHSNKANKPALVHQNLSGEKVLIGDNFSPQLSGAGLHKLLADDVVFSTLKGSAAMGYLAPEYTNTGRFTEKSDVYAFGVILFQILTGKTRVTHLRLVAESGKLEELIDTNLNGNFCKMEAAKLVSIALVCTSETPSQRPKMDVVLKQLLSS